MHDLLTAQASEMAVGPNRNKIYAIAVASFWVSVRKSGLRRTLSL